jgi:outer membrane protein W
MSRFVRLGVMVTSMGLLTLSSTGFAKTTEGLGLEMGLKGGANFHTAAMNNVALAGRTATFGVGLSGVAAFDLMFTELLGMEIDVGWITRGRVTEITTGGVKTTVHTGYNSIALPLLFKFRFMQGDFVPYLGVGVDPYIVVGAGTTTKVGTAADTTATLATTNLNTVGVGALGNLGFIYYVGDVGITMDARYTYSFTNITKTRSATENLQEITALLGVMFNVI